MRYYLVGYMASGKSHKAKEMSKEMGIPFVDLDYYISNKVGMSISDYFSFNGEAAFRQLEKECLQEVTDAYDDVIISTGGGTPCFHSNMEYMNEKGHTIFLNVSIEIILGRLLANRTHRPLVNGKTPEELRVYVIKHLNERLPFYLKAKEQIIVL